MIASRSEASTSGVRTPRFGRPLAVSALAFVVSEVIAGAFFGFASLSTHAAFGGLVVLLVLPAFVIVDRLVPSPSIADISIRTGLVSFAIAVLCGLVLGAARLASLTPYVVAAGLLLAAALFIAPRRAAAPAFTHPALPAALLGFWAAMLAFVIAFGLSHSPYTLYDSLSYHLFFPARWLQARHVSIIPTPFSDEAQAYQPANGELWFLWLMLPFHGDFFARIGQLPFYALGAPVVYALARRMGATPRHALYAPTFFLIAPSVVEQAVGANVDLIHAVLFVTSLYLGIAAVDSDARVDWALWGVSLGLWLGTKYLALVYLPVMLAIPVVGGLRGRAGWALPGVFAFGAPWYLRNWIVAGSPIYPATLTIAGMSIGRGAYTRQAMARSFLHTTDLRLLWVSLAHAYGPTLFLVVVPAAVVMLGVLIVRRAWWPAGFVSLATAAIVVLCWLAVGDNTDSRFLLPAVVTSCSLLPLAFGTRSGLNGALHLGYGLAIAWVLVGYDGSLPAAVPWFMGDWLSLHGVIDRRYIVPFAALTMMAGIAFRLIPTRRWRLPVATMVIGAASVTLAIGAETWCVPSRCDFLQVASPHLRLSYLYGSRWLDTNAGAVPVAYTGINLPYPLAGSHLRREVSYVNIDRHTSWRFDEYARAYRRASTDRGAVSALAAPSGLLMPAISRDGHVDALRPRFERMAGSREAWTTNLDRRGVRYVFISTLDPYEIDYVWHTAQGFPIEDEWARADPSFRLAYENPDVHIYEVHHQ